MKIWVEKIWLKHTQAECKRPGFQNAMLSFHAFAADLTDGVTIQLLEGHSNILAVPANISEKSYGKNCYLDNFVFIPLSPLNNVEKQQTNLASSYVMGWQHCIGGERGILNTLLKIPIIFCR